jgi:hypothetical protein
MENLTAIECWDLKLSQILKLSFQGDLLDQALNLEGQAPVISERDNNQKICLLIPRSSYVSLEFFNLRIPGPRRPPAPELRA